eukprot:TRINITY_DN29080_c0_g1_i1.p1 TRINITY_DN29080_c0_g1~~TRINITY_DN29080_c0_g1_i1.p1  ORF type:complete len:390 (-),score=7.23 TRINITY_DN29080_c0_g1_i1:117-1181(-)
MTNDAALGCFLQGASARSKSRSLHRLNSSGSGGGGGRRRSTDEPVCEMTPLVEALRDDDAHVRRDAARAIHAAVKECAENRARLLRAGGVRSLLDALKSADEVTAERASAGLLYLATSSEAGREIVAAGGLHALVEVLGTGRPAGENNATCPQQEQQSTEKSPEMLELTRANAAAALFTLSARREERKRVLCSAGAVRPLMALLRGSSTARGKKDSCLALYGLVTVEQAAEEAVALGVVEETLSLLGKHGEGVEEKAASLLATLARTKVGAKALCEAEDVVFTLVDVMEGSSAHAAERAASALLAMAQSGGEAMVKEILKEGCLPALARVAPNSNADSDARVLLTMLRGFSARG